MLKDGAGAVGQKRAPSVCPVSCVLLFWREGKGRRAAPQCWTDWQPHQLAQRVFNNGWNSLQMEEVCYLFIFKDEDCCL